MSIGLGQTVVAYAHGDGTNVVLDRVDFIPTMVDTAAVTGVGGAVNAQSNFNVEQVVRNLDGVSRHSWIVKMVLANSFTLDNVGTSTATLGTIIANVDTAIEAWKTGESSDPVDLT